MAAREAAGDRCKLLEALRHMCSYPIGAGRRRTTPGISHGRCRGRMPGKRPRRSASASSITTKA
eukprot:14550905-Alexandrium_andersonii.AAC.1